MFHVIEFHTGEVEVVPANWIIDNKVSWCKTSGSIYARKGFTPKPTWKQYPCTIRCSNKSFESFEEALLKSKRLMEHTDSSSGGLTDLENDTSGKTRGRSSYQHSDYEYCCDEDVDDIPDINDTNLSKTLTPESTTPTLSHSDDPLGNDTTSATTGLDITNLFVPECKCKETKDALLSEIAEVKNAVDYNRRLIEQFIMQMKREWDTIKLQLQNVTRPEQAQQSCSFTNIFVELLPVSSVEDLTICNEVLEDEEKEKSLISKLSTIGGKDAKATLNNIIKHCFTVEGQRLCNWSGVNKNFKLKDTKLISDIVKFVCHTKQSTQVEAENMLKYTFQHTYDRVKSVKKVGLQ